MKVLSVNIGERKEVSWRGNMVTTGIFKTPVDKPICLQKTDVLGDHVVDRRYHGGVGKACYLYGANHYPHWQEHYPDLEWSYGMMGENITVDRCEEEELQIGTIYKVGEAVVQVVQPRQPCFKLGVKFKSQKVLKQFINYAHPGVYFKVLTEGEVRSGDTFDVQQLSDSPVTVQTLFAAVYSRPSDESLAAIVANEVIPEDLRKYLADKYATH